MMKLTIVLIMIALSHAQECSHGPFKLDQPVKVCSRYLSCLVDHICTNSFGIVKRDTTSIMSKLVPDDLYEFTAKKRLVNAARLRPRRAIADECCDNACSVQDIIEYCPPESKIFNTFPLGDT